jgi:hypothetical protein
VSGDTQVPKYDGGSYAKIVTRDASPEGGSNPACARNVRASWDIVFDMGSSENGRATVHKAMKLCAAATLETTDDVFALANWLQAAWDFMVRNSQNSLKCLTFGQSQGPCNVVYTENRGLSYGTRCSSGINKLNIGVRPGMPDEIQAGLFFPETCSSASYPCAHVKGAAHSC